MPLVNTVTALYFVLATCQPYVYTFFFNGIAFGCVISFGQSTL